MFACRAFDREKDKNIFNLMLKKRGAAPAEDFTFFPPTGAVVEFDRLPVCIGFMIKCDNNTCINDGIVSDPGWPKETRNEAVKILRAFLEGKAREHGAKLIIAQTIEEKLSDRLIEQGYVVIEQNVTQLGRKI